MERQLIVNLKYYDQQIRVQLPNNFNQFIKCLSDMLQISEEMIKNFKIYYINSSDNKEYVIEKPLNYILFLNAVKNNKTHMIYIELTNNKEKQLENNNINNQNLNKIQKDDEKDDYDLLNNPYKQSFSVDKNQLNGGKIIKNNSGNILNNIDNDNETLEFSFLDEKKLSKDNNTDNKQLNNHLNQNNINNNINNINNINNNINNINNNIINKNINSYDGHNKLIDNQIQAVPMTVNFNIECDFCQSNRMIGIIFYCQNCSKFFCYNCERAISLNHPHCYYKIRNKEQFKEMCNMHNNNNNNSNQLNNPYNANNNNFQNNNNRNINNNYLINENPIKEIFSEGSKLLGNTLNSVFNFFSPNNNQNNNANNNNNVLKSLLEEAKSQYNLEQINDEEIERALIICKGNIDKAVALLLSNHNK